MNLCFIPQVPKNVSDAQQFTHARVGFPHIQGKLSRTCGLEWEGETFIRWEDRRKHACMRGLGFVGGTSGRHVQTPV